MTNILHGVNLIKVLNILLINVNFKFSGIYGIPRGGLCLAVALSHKLNIKLIQNLLKIHLIVDDVFETGITLNNFKNIEGAIFLFYLVKKNQFGGIQ